MDPAPTAPAPARPVYVKCLIWDLDDTLWTGTLSEGDTTVPRPGVADILAELDRRGVLHAVASRNDHDEAWARLTELDLAEYFVAARISWGSKAESVVQIAAELQFALSAVAFVDDRPEERLEVATRCPEVRCYPPEDIPLLPGLPEFSPGVVSTDATLRRQRYRTATARDRARLEFAGSEPDFLRSLAIAMSIAPAADGDLDRLSELTVRTSQMNATGIPYSRPDIEALAADPDHRVLTVTMADRFGSHGAVGLVLLRVRPEVWHLKSLTTSCRVIPYGAGSALLRWLAGRAAEAGAHLAADLRPTGRNRQMEIAYRFAGFAEDCCPCLAALDGSGPPGVRRLHSVPDRPEAETILRITDDRVDLTGSRRP